VVYKLTIPQAGDVEELRILQWHKGEGEAVGSDELVLELETAKAVLEVRSPRPCVLRKIVTVDEGWARVGPPLAWFSDTVDEAGVLERAEDFAPEWEMV
jgi:2-oxoglutarate dehydrogenase E2 component (dihydrolipoamide succinyltransferase)